MAKDKNGKELPKGISWLTKKNLYMARFQYQGQSYTMYAKTLREAKKLLADKKYEVEHGINGKADKTTLNEWFSIWIETYKKGKVKATTLDTYMRIYNNHVREALGNRYISKIKTVHIQRFYNDFHDEGFSAKYLETLNAMLSNLFKKALESDLIFKNPCVGVVRPSEVKKERRVLSAFEHTELSSFIMREEYGEIVRYWFTHRRTIRNEVVRHRHGWRAKDIERRKNPRQVERHGFGRVQIHSATPEN